MSIYRGVVCDHCPQFEKTCKVVLKHPKGLLVLLNTECEDLKYLEAKTLDNITKPVELREGGDKRGSTRVSSV